LALAACGLALLSAPRIGRAAEETGFYLRGEVAAGWLADAALANAKAHGPDSVLGREDKVKLDTPQLVSIGLGAGYALFPGVRAELSLNDRGKLSLDGRSSSTAATPLKADLKATTGLVTLYLDVADLAVPGGLGGFHPYIGIGGGISWLTLDGISGDHAAGTLELPGGSRRSATWAVGLGTGIDLTDRLMLDVGYRFVDMGTLATRGGQARLTTPAGTFVAPSDPLEIAPRFHEAYVGLRYSF